MIFVDIVLGGLLVFFVLGFLACIACLIKQWRVSLPVLTGLGILWAIGRAITGQ